MSRRKYEINKNFFDIIDTEEKAYFLGLLYADGYNNRNRDEVTLSLIDKDLVEKLRDLIQPNKPISLRTYKNSNQKDSFSVKIKNKHISETLENLGCGNNKTFKIEFPRFLEEGLYNHFIRGYFDGDGCLYVSSKNIARCEWKIIGTENFLLKIQSILISNLNFNKTKLSCRFSNKENNNIRELVYGGRKQCLTIGNWMYEDATIYLKRKYDKFLLLNKLEEDLLKPEDTRLCLV